MVRLLFTVPHAARPPIERPGEHLWDRAAEWWARHVAAELQRVPGVTAGVLIASTTRDRSQGGEDQNRPESRRSAFRGAISNVTQRGVIDVLFDMHSFPPQSDYSAFDVLFLDPLPLCNQAYVAPRAKPAFSVLGEAMLARGVNVGSATGACSNDIVVRAREVGTPAMLLEFAETLPRDERTLALVADAFRDWLGVLKLPENARAQFDVLSPVSGTVEVAENQLVHIYIAPDDPHGVFMPASGVVRKIWAERGVFLSPPPGGDARISSIFVAPEWKTEQVHLLIDYAEGALVVQVELEVGHPEYITDTVSLHVREGEAREAGAQIGEILIGSRAIVRYSGDTPPFTTVAPGQHVEGGRTVIATVW